jgi:hypothetical protein
MKNSGPYPGISFANYDKKITLTIIPAAKPMHAPISKLRTSLL